MTNEEIYMQNRKECLRVYISYALTNEWLNDVTLADFDIFFKEMYLNYISNKAKNSFRELEELYKSFVIGLREGRKQNKGVVII